MCSKEDCEDTVKSLLEQESKNFYLKRLILESKSPIKITCRECDNQGIEGNSRGFLKNNPLEIVLCTNRLKNTEIIDTLTHEAVHVYDYINDRVDFNSCNGLAYSEVRAAREGECNNLMYYPFKWMKVDCVKQHATRSTANLYPGKGAEYCVAAVFKEAMADLHPLPAATTDH